MGQEGPQLLWAAILGRQRNDFELQPRKFCSRSYLPVARKETVKLLKTKVSNNMEITVTQNAEKYTNVIVFMSPVVVDDIFV